MHIIIIFWNVFSGPNSRKMVSFQIKKKHWWVHNNNDAGYYQRVFKCNRRIYSFLIVYQRMWIRNIEESGSKIIKKIMGKLLPEFHYILLNTIVQHPNFNIQYIVNFIYLHFLMNMTKDFLAKVPSVSGRCSGRFIVPQLFPMVRSRRSPLV